MRISKALLIFKKDWREVSRNWQVLLPIFIIPLIFSIFLPLLLVTITNQPSMIESQHQDLTLLMRNLPTHVRDEVRGMTSPQIFVYLASLYFFAPFFLIIPLMASSVIASDSFAGEKERKTIEALLATPLSDSELFLGKILVSFIPSMIVTVISFLIYSTMVNLISTNVFQGTYLLPNLVWLLMILGLAPTLAIAGIGLTVMISVRVKGFREAQQISALLVIPILMLVFGQISGIILFGPMVVISLIGLFIGIDIIIIQIGVRLFQRETILSKLT
jgi:ABC-type Na+ efflux pump permease subunit